MTGETSATCRYRTAAGLQLRSWGESVDAVYLASTRNTHLVDASAAVFLKTLQATDGAATVHELWTALDADTEHPEPADTGAELARLQDRLEQLVAAGLLFRVG